jgi:hypothetical protein
MVLKTKTLLIAVIILIQTVCAQKPTPFFGWDLTYESVLEKNNVGRDEWIWKWLKYSYKLDCRFLFISSSAGKIYSRKQSNE